MQLWSPVLIPDLDMYLVGCTLYFPLSMRTNQLSRGVQTKSRFKPPFSALHDGLTVSRKARTRVVVHRGFGQARRGLTFSYILINPR